MADKPPYKILEEYHKKHPTAHGKTMGLRVNRTFIGTSFTNVAISSTVRQILNTLRSTQEKNKNTPKANTLEAAEYNDLSIQMKLLISFAGSYGDALDLLYSEIAHRMAVERGADPRKPSEVDEKLTVNDISAFEAELNKYFPPDGFNVRIKRSKRSKSNKQLGLAPSITDLKDLEDRIIATIDDPSASFAQQVEGLDEMGFSYLSQMATGNITDPKRLAQINKQEEQARKARRSIKGLTDIELDRIQAENARLQERSYRQTDPLGNWGSNFIYEKLAEKTGGFVGSQHSPTFRKLIYDRWLTRVGVRNNNGDITANPLSWLKGIGATLVAEGLGTSEGIRGGLKRIINPFVPTSEHARQIAEQRYNAIMMTKQTQDLHSDKDGDGIDDTKQQFALIKQLEQRLRNLETAGGMPSTHAITRTGGKGSPPIPNAVPPTSNDLKYNGPVFGEVPKASPFQQSPSIQYDPKTRSFLGVRINRPAREAPKPTPTETETEEADERADTSRKIDVSVPVVNSDEIQEPSVSVDQSTGPNTTSTLVKLAQSIKQLIAKVDGLTEKDDLFGKLFGMIRNVLPEIGAIGAGIGGMAAGAAAAVGGAVAVGAGVLLNQEFAHETSREIDRLNSLQAEGGAPSTGMYSVPRGFEDEARRQTEARTVTPAPIAQYESPVVNREEALRIQREARTNRSPVGDRLENQLPSRSVGAADRSNFQFEDFEIDTIVGGLDNTKQRKSAVIS